MQEARLYAHRHSCATEQRVIATVSGNFISRYFALLERNAS